ncbi:type VI secretion system tip protein VgrG [Bacillus subtilis subsp. subtilis]|nr:type VI secretion system tip protein VgrG [Bacillus subtilis subsp. subtilis]
MARTITLQSDLGNRLRFSRLHASDTLGQPYCYRVVALFAGTDPDLTALLGTPVAITVQHGNGTRHFHGIVAEAEQRGQVHTPDLVYIELELVLVPRLWLLGHRRDCRIFTAVSVPDIVRQLLGEIGCSDLRLRLSAQYPAREYCVQYHESSLDFISRLLEQEGIYYYFEHSASTHTLVLADGIGSHARAEPFARLPWQPTLDGRVAGVGEWCMRRRLHSQSYQLGEYDPLRPRAALQADADLAGDGLHGVGGLQVYHWHGTHGVLADGQRYAQVRAEAHNAERAGYQGRTNAWGLAAGQLFDLVGCDHTGSNQEYLVVASTLALGDGAPVSGAGEAAAPDCRFQALESRLPFRSPLRTRWPRIAGLQSAVVAGDREEDIAVDAHGRVTVQFHWSTPARPNGKVSCPVRVASSWAGKGWGMQSLPRVGQEVLVGFLDGDPDRPLVVGSVFNADHMPPYALPDSRTQSGIRSRSHPDGGPEDYNEIRFDDRKGSEDFLLHAQKDLHEEVENDHVVQVDHDEQVHIGNDQRLVVAHDQTETIQHDRRVQVDNTDLLKVGTSATRQIGTTWRLEAGSRIELVTGASSIVMDSAGDIAIKGVNIRIEGSSTLALEGGVQVTMKAGASMDIGAGASLKMHSDATLQVQAGATAEVKAPMLGLSADALAKLNAALVMIG